MPRSRMPIPEDFASAEEAAAFWDRRSTADYEGLMEDVEIELSPILMLIAAVNEEEEQREVAMGEEAVFVPEALFVQQPLFVLASTEIVKKLDDKDEEGDE